MSEVAPSLGVVRFGVFEVDFRKGEIRKHNFRIRLQEQPFRILQILLEHPGELVTREEIQRRIWPADTFVDFEKGLNNAIRKLRDALGDSAEQPRFIETHSRRGYRFIASITATNSAGRSEEAVSPIEVSVPAQSRLLYRRLAFGAVVLLAFVATLFGFDIGGVREHWLTRASSPVIHSLAVLPLQNLSSDPNQEYFADGMTDALITDLAQIGSLKVISRTSTMRYKKTDKGAPEIARELNVDGIVEGTIQRSENRVRVTAQLIYAPNDRHLWANTYEKDQRDVFALQSEVARAIASEINVKMTPGEQQRLQSPRPVNFSAVVAYLEGRSHLEKFQELQFQKDLQKSNQEEFSKAVGSFERAMQEDPNYPQARLGYFDAMNSYGENHLEFLQKAKEGINRALSLDVNFVDAHIYMGDFLSQYEWNWPGAEREYQRALELSPNSAKAHEAYSRYLMSMGRGTEADKEEELARRLDPLCSDSYDGPLGCLDFEQQLKYLEETGTPGKMCFLYGGVGKDLLVEGKHAEAITTFEKMMRVCGYPEMADTLARGYAYGDYKSAIRAWQVGMEKEIANHQPLPALWMAFMYSALDDRNNAFRWLEKAYENHSWCILYLKYVPIWDPIRSDPRFQDIVRRAGLPE